MDNALEVVRKARRKNKIEREISDNENKIRDNRKRAALLDNLMEYVTPDMCYNDFINIMESMKADYEERVNDYLIKNAELGREKKEIIQKIKAFTDSHSKSTK